MFRSIVAKRAALRQLNQTALRGFATGADAPRRGSSLPLILGLVGVGGGAYYAKSAGLFDSLLGVPASVDKDFKPDYDAVRQAISDHLEDDPDYDDGSYGPVLVRLAWHTSGTYDAKTNKGGSNGATQRFSPESNWGANAGLEHARNYLEPIKRQFPWISYSDLWTLAGATAIEYMGGPHIPWRPGRSDVAEGERPPLKDGLLPDGARDNKHIRDVFGRLGFNDQETVALIGAHTLGRCHADRSGFDGPWTFAPTTFSNMFFTELRDNKWHKRKWDGPLQYQDKSNTLMMLPTDMWLLWDKNFRKYVEVYANDQDKFSDDFSKAFSRLLELGVPFKEGTEYV